MFSAQDVDNLPNMMNLHAKQQSNKAETHVPSMVPESGPSKACKDDSTTRAPSVKMKPVRQETTVATYETSLLEFDNTFR